MDNISNEMIKKAARGDHHAFESLYRACAKFVYNVAWRIVHTHEDASEVTQEVFITVYRKLDHFRFHSSFKTWIYRIAINTAVNYAKKMSRIKGKATEYQEPMHSVAVVSDAEQVADKENHEHLVSTLLNALNDDQRACVVLRNLQGLSYQEIAETLNININTVRSRLSRARAAMLKLRKAVTDQIFSGEPHPPCRAHPSLAKPSGQGEAGHFLLNEMMENDGR